MEAKQSTLSWVSGRSAESAADDEHHSTGDKRLVWKTRSVADKCSGSVLGKTGTA